MFNLEYKFDTNKKDRRIVMKLHLKKEEIIFFLTWFIYFLSYTLLILSELSYMYNVHNIYLYIRTCCFVFLVFDIFKTVFYKKNILFIIFISVTVVLASLFARSLSFFSTLLFSVAFIKIDFNRFIKVDLFTKLFSCLTVITLCLFKVVDNYTVTINGVYKRSLGFGHPNTLGLFIAIIVIEYFYIKFDQLNLGDYIFAIACIGLLNAIGTSRTVLLLLPLFLVIIFLLHNHRLQRFLLGNVGMKLAMIFPAMIAASCYLLSYLYDNSNTVLFALNRLMTTRLHWSNFYLMDYGISLFGTKISPVTSRMASMQGSTSSNSFDMAYVRMGVQYGIIMFFLFIIALVIIQKYAIMSKNWPLLACNIYFILLGIVENHLYSSAMNIFLLLYMQPLLGNFYKKNFPDRKIVKSKFCIRLF